MLIVGYLFGVVSQSCQRELRLQQTTINEVGQVPSDFGLPIGFLRLLLRLIIIRVNQLFIDSVYIVEWKLDAFSSVFHSQKIN
jgi:hypothetical protein